MGRKLLNSQVSYYVISRVEYGKREQDVKTNILTIEEARAQLANFNSAYAIFKVTHIVEEVD